MASTDPPLSGQEVVTHCRKLSRKTREQLWGLMELERSKGLKALSRDRRQRLEAYQHLFYLLQVRRHQENLRRAWPRLG